MHTYPSFQELPKKKGANQATPMDFFSPQDEKARIISNQAFTEALPIAGCAKTVKSSFVRKFQIDPLPTVAAGLFRLPPCHVSGMSTFVFEKNPGQALGGNGFIYLARMLQRLLRKIPTRLFRKGRTIWSYYAK